MSSFVVDPAPAASPPIISDFWPPIQIADFTEFMRVGGAKITDARKRSALKNAIIAVESELADKMAAWQNEGQTALSNIEGREIDGETHLVILWRRAIYCTANAELIDTHPDISATNDGLAGVGTLANVAADLRATALAAIRQIIGPTSSFVKLI